MAAQLRDNNQGIIKITTGALNKNPEESAPKVVHETPVSARIDGGKSLALLPAIYEFADLLKNHTIADGINGTYKAGRFLRRAVFITEKNKDATALDRAVRR